MINFGYTVPFYDNLLDENLQSAPALARRRGENICVYPPTIISLLPTGRRIRRILVNSEWRADMISTRKVRLPFLQLLLSVSALVWSSTLAIQA